MSDVQSRIRWLLTQVHRSGSRITEQSANQRLLVRPPASPRKRRNHASELRFVKVVGVGKHRPCFYERFRGRGDFPEADDGLALGQSRPRDRCALSLACGDYRHFVSSIGAGCLAAPLH
jgi:hypothetical protein